MRDSLKKSIADSPAKGFERYPKGSLVICNACARPIFKLDAPIELGTGSGKMARAFKPLTVSDLDTLADRDDVDAGLRSWAALLTPMEKQLHVGKLREVHAGDPMLCPCCGDCFVQVLSVEHHEVLDKAYTIELLTVPPQGVAKPSPLTGKHIGVGKGWVH